MTAASSSKPVSIGLIGIGGRLRSVVRLLLESAPAGSLNIRAVYDPLDHSHTELRQQLGYDYERVDTEEALLAHPEIDWVMIGSWNSHHARHAIGALNAGKNVFCEKPLATSLEDALAIRAAADASGKTFVFGLVLRYSKHYQRMQEVIASGVLGRIISFEFNETLTFNHGGYIFGNWRRRREDAGTHLLEKCCHDLDLANWMIGALPLKVASFGGTDFFTPAHAPLRDRLGRGPDGEEPYRAWPDPLAVDPFDGGANIFDNQVIILQYANGVRGTFHTNCNAAIAERRFYICGTEGTLRADLYASTLEYQQIGWETKVEKFDTASVDGHGGGDRIMAAALGKTMLEGGQPATSVLQGIQSAIVAFGVDRAADEGRIVDLAPLWCQVGVDPLKV